MKSYVRSNLAAHIFGSELPVIAIQLGFIKMTGSTLNARERIPLGAMFQLSETLRTQKIHIATTRSLYPRRSTLYEVRRQFV